jgi:hypothetical protein
LKRDVLLEDSPVLPLLTINIAGTNVSDRYAIGGVVILVLIVIAAAYLLLRKRSSR